MSKYNTYGYNVDQETLSYLESIFGFNEVQRGLQEAYDIENYLKEATKTASKQSKETKKEKGGGKFDVAPYTLKTDVSDEFVTTQIVIPGVDKSELVNVTQEKFETGPVVTLEFTNDRHLNIKFLTSTIGVHNEFYNGGKKEISFKNGIVTVKFPIRKRATRTSWEIV